MLQRSGRWLRSFALAVCVALGFVSGLGSMSSVHAQLTGELGAHDPSTLLYDDGRYYYFATGDLLAVRSSSNLTSWTNEGVAFNSVPAWVPSAVPGYSGQSLWAPDVIKLGDQYYLYYSASVWGTKLSAIGYATSPTLDPDAPDYGWTDLGMIISSNHGSPYNAIDPSLMLDEDTGRLWMTWGSFNNGIYVKEMNPATGAPLNSSLGVNVAAPSPTPEIEGAAMVKHNGYYYMFVNWGGCCSGVDSTYNIRVGRSTSPTGPFLDRDGVNMLSDGGTLFLDDDGRKIGPGHFSFVNIDGQDKFSYHYYNGDVVGGPTYGLRDLYWTSDDWPSIAAVNPNWIATTNSAWSQASNWTNGTVPDGAGHVANFVGQSPGQNTVELATGRTVGTINFRGASAYTLGSTTGPTITLDDIAGENATLNVAEGNHTISSPLTALDQLEVNVTPAANRLLLRGTLTAPGLNKYGDGALLLGGTGSSIAGSLFVKNGSLTLAGSLTANSFSSVGQIFDETATMTVLGTGSFTSNGDLNIGDTGSSTTPATGTLNIQNNASVTVGTGGGFYVGSGFFANTRAEGTVNQSGGTLTVSRPGDGSFIIGGRTSTLASGTYNLSGGTVEANTNVFVGGRGDGTVNQTGGFFDAGQFVSLGRYSGSTGNWNISDGELSQSNSSDWLLIGEEGEGTLTIEDNGLVTSNGTLWVGYRNTSQGTINLHGGILRTKVLRGGAGQATVKFNGGTLRPLLSSTSFILGPLDALVQTGGAVLDTHTYDVTVRVPLLHDSSLGATADGGLFKQGTGTLRLTEASSYTGVTIIEAGSLLAINSSGSATGTGEVTVMAGATLGGTGSIAGNVSVANGGTIAPGITRGSLAVGSVLFDASSTLSIELAAAIEYDQLVVTGDATLDGLLDLNLFGDFVPTAGELFEIVDVSGTLSGEFSGLQQGDLVGVYDGVGLFIDYTAGDGNDVALLAQSVLGGDFDLSGHVQGFDFLEWQRGESFDPLSSGDLDAWQANYGTTAESLAASQSVPEPASLALLGACGLLTLLGRSYDAVQRDGR